MEQESRTYSIHQINDVINFGTDKIIKSVNYVNANGDLCMTVVIKNLKGKLNCIEIPLNQPQLNCFSSWDMLYNDRLYKELRFKIIEPKYTDLINDIDNSETKMVKIGTVNGITIYRFNDFVSLKGLRNTFSLVILLFIEYDENNKAQRVRYVIDCD